MVIYKTINKINGKWYIGKDVKNNPKYFGSGIAIKKAINKYGTENFEKIILEICDDKNHLSDREKYWIDFTNAKSDPMSYNLANSGQGGDLSEFMKPSPLKNKTYEEVYGEEKTEEIKRKRSEALSGSKNGMYGKTISAEHRKKLSDANRNREYHFSDEHKKNLSNSLKGKKASDETRKKMSITRTGKTHKGKTIFQLDDTGNIIREFSSIREAAKTLNIPYRDCHYICEGNQTHIKRHKINLKKK